VDGRISRDISKRFAGKILDWNIPLCFIVADPFIDAAILEFEVLLSPDYCFIWKEFGSLSITVLGSQTIGWHAVPDASADATNDCSVGLSARLLYHLWLSICTLCLLSHFLQLVSGHLSVCLRPIRE
jgi:hypothetical protein